MNQITSVAWRLTGPLRPFAKRYATTLGLDQNWQMFANPPRGAEYLRLRYYSTVDATAGSFRLGTELVFPVVPDEQGHTVAAFWQGHQDKAVSDAFGAYFRARLSRMDAGAPPPAIHDLDGVLAPTLVPTIRYFSSRYVQGHTPEAHLVRTEAWYGWAPSRLRGDVPISPVSRERAIARYYEGIADRVVVNPAFQPLDTIEREVDITWMLIHADE
jgi:hypothetical protein